MNLNLKNPLAFFDLEATGIDTIKDRIVEISIVKLMPNGEKEIHTHKINPTVAIPEITTKIHGISDEDVKDAPTFKQMAKTFASILKGCDLAGFNIMRFDVPMLVEEFLRAGVDFDISNRKLIDLQRIYHMMEPRTLSAAYKFYCNKELEGAHSAEVDTMACVGILEEQVKRYENMEHKDSLGNVTVPVKNDMEALHQLSFSNRIDLAGRMVYNEKNEAVFAFGKHKDKKIEDVLTKESSYYDWIMKNDFPLNTKQELTRIKLKMSMLNK
ncbi:MAG: DNA polymerase III subunit epsilon [Flexibacter sp. CG_4_10_14_3_um_filter_32_15]|nr:MAG: DNA polymerase III subunit epsilon [Flexibacter sp. CG_4_10_14_3_um_filter_32_15]